MGSIVYGCLLFLCVCACLCAGVEIDEEEGWQKIGMLCCCYMKGFFALGVFVSFSEACMSQREGGWIFGLVVKVKGFFDLLSEEM